MSISTINHPVLTQYNEWKEKHPEEDYPYDEIHEFFGSLSRSEMQGFMEWVVVLHKAFTETD